MIPGWPYSVVAALEPGRTSWTLPLDAVRLGPADDATEVTAAQVRQVADRIIAAGHWRDGDPDILVVLDAGYDLTRLAWLLADLPVEVLGRLRSDRVMYFPAPPRAPGTNGRPSRHGAALRLSDPGTWPVPAVTTVTQTTRYGTARAAALPCLSSVSVSRDTAIAASITTLFQSSAVHCLGSSTPKDAISVKRNLDHDFVSPPASECITYSLDLSLPLSRLFILFALLEADFFGADVRVVRPP